MELALIVFLIAWIIGLVGTFVPVVPATFIIFVGSVIATYLHGFDTWDWFWLAGIGIVSVLISLVDNVTSGWGTRRYGGSKQAMWGAMIGGIVGIFLPLGLIIGPLGGALIAEVGLAKRPLDVAMRSAWGAMIGVVTGIAAKFVLHVLIGIVEIVRLLS